MIQNDLDLYTRGTVAAFGEGVYLAPLGSGVEIGSCCGPGDEHFPQDSIDYLKEAHGLVLDPDGDNYEEWYVAGHMIGKANASRVAACWNACDGISTEALQGGVITDLLALAAAALFTFQGETPAEHEARTRRALTDLRARLTPDAFSSLSKVRGESSSESEAPR